MKIFKIAFLVCFLSAFLFGDTYVIEADGKFADELKEVVQKHSKDENSSVEIYKKSTGDLEKQGYQKVGAMANRGKEIYMQKCFSCHGETGEKRAYGVSQPLKNMTGEEIAVSVHSYINDEDHGGKFKMVMRSQSMKLTDGDLDFIIAYIKGEDDPYLNRSFIGGSYWENQNKPIQTTPTEQGSYLK